MVCQGPLDLLDFFRAEMEFCGSDETVDLSGPARTDDGACN